MNLLNIPDDFISFEDDDKITYDFNLTVFRDGDRVKFAVGKTATSWMGIDDDFIDRIQFEKLNPCFLERHLAKEIKIRNALERGVELLESEKYAKAIGKFDEVLYYDSEYGRALLFNSKAFFAQGHFVKSLRTYKKAVTADDRLRDGDYHRLLLKKSSEERDSFPKIKKNIYAGDEHFARGEYERALESYERALANPTSFKNRILSKLLNKKATALVKLDRIDEAVEVFKESIKSKPTDYAYFNLGVYGSDCEALKRNLSITKAQLLMKARRLAECGEADMALDCLDEFFDNHFRVDDDYRKALNLKLDVLKSIGGDVGEVERILEAI